MEEPKIIKSQVLFDHPGVRVIQDTLGYQGLHKPYIYLESPIEAVATLGVTAQSEALLTRQYRHPVSQVIYDLPAGRLHPGEKPLDGARREFEEETGFSPQVLLELGYYNQFPGSMRAGTHLFFARDLTEREQHLDEGEFLEVVKVPLHTARAWVMDGRIIDGSLQLALLLALEKGLVARF